MRKLPKYIKQHTCQYCGSCKIECVGSEIHSTDRATIEYICRNCGKNQIAWYTLNFEYVTGSDMNEPEDSNKEF